MPTNSPRGWDGDYWIRNWWPRGQSAGVAPELAAKFDERLDPWYYRYGKVFWHDSALSHDRLGRGSGFRFRAHVSLIRQEIEDAAQEGECVLVGRGAACALACHPGCFHLFVYATSKAKRDWFASTFPKQAPHAEQLLAAFDKRRAAVIRKFYQQEWCARGLYHMLLNSAMGIDAMIDAVLGAARLQADASEAVSSQIGSTGERC